ncbi:MAG: HypC/HybG/HupF family hydrogenase formation chaperone [Nitrospinota bacterium]
MCLAIPVKVVEIEGSMAVIEVGGITRQASLMLVPEAEIGDYVLVHAGFAIQRLDEEEALETLRLLAEIAAMDDVSTEQANALEAS